MCFFLLVSCLSETRVRQSRTINFLHNNFTNLPPKTKYDTVHMYTHLFAIFLLILTKLHTQCVMLIKSFNHKSNAPTYLTLILTLILIQWTIITRQNNCLRCQCQWRVMLRKPGNWRMKMQRFSRQLSFRSGRRQHGRSVLRRPRKIGDNNELVNHSKRILIDWKVNTCIVISYLLCRYCNLS